MALQPVRRYLGPEWGRDSQLTPRTTLPVASAGSCTFHTGVGESRPPVHKFKTSVVHRFCERCVRRSRLNPFVVTLRRFRAARLHCLMTDRPAFRELGK